MLVRFLWWLRTSWSPTTKEMVQVSVFGQKKRYKGTSWSKLSILGPNLTWSPIIKCFPCWAWPFAWSRMFLQIIKYFPCWAWPLIKDIPTCRPKGPKKGEDIPMSQCARKRCILFFFFFLMKIHIVTKRKRVGLILGKSNFR